MNIAMKLSIFVFFPLSFWLAVGLLLFRLVH